MVELVPRTRHRMASYHPSAANDTSPHVALHVATPVYLPTVLVGVPTETVRQPTTRAQQRFPRVYFNIAQGPGILYTRDPRDSAKYPKYIIITISRYTLYTRGGSFGPLVGTLIIIKVILIHMYTIPDFQYGSHWPHCCTLPKMPHCCTLQT